MIELRLGAVTRAQRAKQGERRLDADPVARRDVGHDLKAFGREVLHGGSFLAAATTTGGSPKRFASALDDYTPFVLADRVIDWPSLIALQLPTLPRSA